MGKASMTDAEPPENDSILTTETTQIRRSARHFTRELNPPTHFPQGEKYTLVDRTSSAVPSPGHQEACYSLSVL